MWRRFLTIYYLPRILFGGKYSRSISGKLGKLPQELAPELLPRPIAWFHAVSVGEAVALAPIIKYFKRLAPEISVLVSTGTETGQDKARDLINDAAGFFYLPLDFPEFVDPVVNKIRPDLFVLLETELWPNLIHSLKNKGCKIALANGRISDRSFPRYMKLRRFFAPLLQQMDLFMMASDTDAMRIKQMGGQSQKICVTGNTKYDALPGNTSGEIEAEMRALFEIGPDKQVFCSREHTSW